MHPLRQEAPRLRPWRRPSSLASSGFRLLEGRTRPENQETPARHPVHDRARILQRQARGVRQQDQGRHPHGLRLPPREQPHRPDHAPMRWTRHTPTITKNPTHEDSRSPKKMPGDYPGAWKSHIAADLRMRHSAGFRCSPQTSLTLNTAVLAMKKPFSFGWEKGDGGGYEIRTREAVTPTRFPSVRHRPLGESSMRFPELLNKQAQHTIEKA